MQRSVAAYLSDILDACDSIESILSCVDLDTYLRTREKRSAVEREFIIIGEAVAAMRRDAPELVGDISHARLIVGFRNVLTHDYAAIDDETVYELARTDLPDLRRECETLLARAD
ncbi:MAG: HepT-like ribonuclease domain-containing protein [Coriobacteriia bacterium]|nr:HepT-like ribonuclease domain-containing protein [Coriobacteriia bacterium]